VLLLDEPGHSLHPLAQRDLSAFFDGLAADNQILYTTHSPFLVDADRLARARKVYVEADGSTRATGDLLLSEGSDTLRGAGFAIRAALNMAVAEASMRSAQPVLVQGMIEQMYLSMIKTLCIAEGRFLPRFEMVFAPACSTEVMHAMARMLGNDEAGAPMVLVDDSTQGRRLDISRIAPDRLVALWDVTGLSGASIEDLMPRELLATHLDRVERRPESLFADQPDTGQPFLDAAEAWASDQGITLAPDWRLQLAQRLQQRLLGEARRQIDSATLTRWSDLLQRLARA
jgi:hypothetical protein